MSVLTASVRRVDTEVDLVTERVCYYAKAKSFYTNRITRSHRDHRAAPVDHNAGAAKGQTTGTVHYLRQQPQAIWNRNSNVHNRK